MAIQREIIESEIRTSGGKQTQDDIIRVNQAVRDLGNEEKNLLFIKAKLESQGKKNTAEWKKNEEALKTNKVAVAKQREELTKLNSQLKITEMTYNQLSKRAQELRGKLNNISKATDPEKWNKYNRELGQVNNQMGRVRSGSTNAGSAMSKLSGGLTKLGIYGATAFAVMKAGEAVLRSTGAAGDKLDEVLGSVKTTLGFIGKSIASLDFKNFFQGLKKSWKAGKEYAKSLDEIDQKTRQLNMAEADAKRYMLERQQILRSEMATDKARIQAADEIIAKENELAELRRKIAQQAYDAEINKFLAAKNLTKEQLENYIRTGEAAQDAMKELGKGTDEELNNIVELYKAWQDADTSALENLMRTTTRRDSLLARDKKETEKNDNEQLEKKKALYARLDKLIKDFQLQQKKGIDREIAEIVDKYQEEADAFEKAYKDKIITVQEYYDAIERITAAKDKEVTAKKTDFAGENLKDMASWASSESKKAVEDFEKKRAEFVEEFRGKSADELKQMELEKLEEYTAEGIISVEEFEQAKADIEEKYRQEKLEKIKEELAITKALFETASDVVSTIQDTEITKLETAYDKKIELAGNNSKEVARLEEEKEKKIKETKKKYADIAFAITVAQIISSTAQAAIDAFKSMAGIPYVGPVLGGLAAAAAVALGAVQIANAKAQRDQVKSLWTGGYTGEGEKRQPKGVVHADEYVVASDELAMPEVRSFIGGVVEPMRMRRLGYSPYARSTTLPGAGFYDGGYSGSAGSSSGFDSKTLTSTLQRQNRLLSANNALLNKLYTDGVNSNFDENKIYEMRQRISKQESGEDLAAR